MAVFLKPDRIYSAYGVTVKEFFLNKHNDNNIALPAKRVLPLEGITAHNTPTINAAKGTTMAEQHVRATYNGNMGTVIVQFYVDDVEAWACYPEEYQSWHAGSKKNGKGEPEKNGSHKGNQATISIEIIGNSAKAEDNAARLIAYLLNKYNMGIDKLFTHNYWVNVRRGKTGSVDYLNKLDDGYKGCPIYIRPHWDNFKAGVEKYMKSYGTSVDVAKTDNSFRVRVLDVALNIRAGAGVNNAVVGVIRDNGVYTIVETEKVGKTEWGRLKSDVGWISLGNKYVVKL